jgi:hypothetical protein
MYFVIYHERLCVQAQVFALVQLLTQRHAAMEERNDYQGMAVGNPDTSVCIDLKSGSHTVHARSDA